MSEKGKVVILGIIFLMYSIINIVIFTSQDKKVEEKSEKIEVVEEKATIKEDTIKRKSEADRMKSYVANFLQKIGEKDYGFAYELLYPEFKEKYFKTEELFIKYCEEKYSAFMSVEYRNLERYSEYYVYTTTLKDQVNSNRETYTQRFVIKEIDFYDYFISFSV